jgi:hypothetical protein
MVRELVEERVSGATPQALGPFGPRAYPTSGFAGGAASCPGDCCRYTPGRPSRPA